MRCRNCDTRMKKVVIPKYLRRRIDANRNDLYVCPHCELLGEIDHDENSDGEVHWFKRAKVVHEVEPLIAKTLENGWKTSW